MVGPLTTSPGDRMFKIRQHLAKLQQTLSVEYFLFQLYELQKRKCSDEYTSIITCVTQCTHKLCGNIYCIKFYANAINIANNYKY